MTRTCSLELSCTTFAITEACACRIEPGGSVAKPTVCACTAPASSAAANATPIFLIMNPPPRVAASLTHQRQQNDTHHGHLPAAIVAAPFHEAAQGPHPVFRDRRSAAAQAAERRA